MKSTNKPYKTTSTYTSDFPMTEGSSSDSTATPSQSTTSQKLTPSYYLGKYKGIEAFDVCMDFARDSYNIGVAIAYLLRAGKKPNNPMANDLLKAIDHIKKEIEYIGYDIERAQLKSQATEDDKS